jgi:alpha-mannosidase
MRLHLVPNSHIDPVWLWDKYEGIDEVINTFRSACDRLEEYAHLTFSASSLQFYEWLLL